MSTRHEYNAVIAERIEMTEGLAAFRVVPDSKVVTPFEAGQFTNLGLAVPGVEDGFVRRAFSIASAPEEQRWYEFYVRLVDNGALTVPMWKLGPGDRMWLDPKIYGKFTLEPFPRDKDLLLLGTGTGVAPYMSMLRSQLGKGRWRRCVLLESERTAPELGYRAELEEMQRADRTFRFVATLTREPETSTWRGLRGRMQAFLAPEPFERASGVPLSPASCHAFLCGNPDMIESVSVLLGEQGFQPHRTKAPGQVHTERYW